MQVEGDFWRDGVVCVRGAFDNEHVALAERAIDAVLSDPSPRAKRASATDDGAFLEDFCNWTRIPEMERFIRESPSAGIARQLLGTSAIRLYHDHVLAKEPGTRQPTPWHQDLPYYNIEGNQTISMWMPVDPVPAESTLRCIVGSHLGGWFMPRTFLDHQAKWFPEGSLRELPDANSIESLGKIVGWALEPGDAVFFHMLTLHAASGHVGTGATGRRRVLSLRFVGDDVTFAPRPWVTSPPFDGLADELTEGSPLDHALFPELT